MKIARFRVDDGPVRLGRVEGDAIVDVSSSVGTSLRALLPGLGAVRDAAGPRIPLDAVTLEAPIDDPQKYLGIGMNYREHAEEARQAGIPIPTSQLWFGKQVSCITGPHAEIHKPAVSDELDYEIELGVVIGRRCRHVRVEDARSVIAGYVVVNDVSVRDWLQQRSPTFTLGKSFDTHGPMGPWLTTDDEIADPLKLRMTLSVNGEVRQDAVTDDMVDDVYEQIAYLTQVMTLMPGDVLATGTSSGIGAPTGRFLKVGDVVRAEIEGLGAIENRVVAEPRLGVERPGSGRSDAACSCQRGAAGVRRREPCGGGGLMPPVRASVELPGFGHENPIPVASRIGPFVASGALTGRDPVTRAMPPALDAQCANVFAHVRALMPRSGGRPATS